MVHAPTSPCGRTLGRRRRFQRTSSRDRWICGGDFLAKINSRVSSDKNAPSAKLKRDKGRCSCRMDVGMCRDELAGTCNVCAVAAGALYWDRWDWDERDRGDSADDGVCGFGVGFAG